MIIEKVVSLQYLSAELCCVVESYRGREGTGSVVPQIAGDVLCVSETSRIQYLTAGPLWVLKC